MAKLNILVTGTSRGIGKSIAAALSAHNVVGHSSRGEEGRIAADLSHPGAPEPLWAEALDRLGGHVDVLVNNAGIFEAAPIDPSHADWVSAWGRTRQSGTASCRERGG